MKAHPVADLFPMLATDELAELAEDIKQRGLLHPIVLDSDGLILDGRNRHAACVLAGVEPEFVTYDGADADGYALAVNGQRRNMTKGQRASIGGLFLKNNPERTQEEIARALGVSRSQLAYAVIVHTHAPDLAVLVLSGAKPLNEAYKTATDMKKATEDATAQLARLGIEAPDLADLVAEERMALVDALAALRARDAQCESDRRAAITNLRSVLTYLTSTVLKPRELAESYSAVLDEFDPADLDFAAQTMTAISEWSDRGEA